MNALWKAVLFQDLQGAIVDAGVAVAMLLCAAAEAVLGAAPEGAVRVALGGVAALQGELGAAPPVGSVVPVAHEGRERSSGRGRGLGGRRSRGASGHRT